jgi:hypothetical protein
MISQMSIQHEDRMLFTSTSPAARPVTMCRPVHPVDEFDCLNLPDPVLPMTANLP